MLPAPDLDDRRFQDLVDDAKRLVQRRCPEWTDHNVSDPGVTLIETFAFMVDQLLYRVNRVPDRNHVVFLELLGLTLFPPTAAKVPVTFWLSAPQNNPVTVPAGTEVATLRTEVDESVSFMTTAELVVPSVSRTRLVTQGAGDKEPADRTDVMELGEGFPCFAAKPVVGDCLYVGLSEPAPTAAVALRMACTIEGLGVDPTNPPLAWEAWDGTGWAACDVDRDETGGLNRDGDVVLHLPPNHAASVVAGERAGWVRARIVEAEEGQPRYTESPRISGAEAFAIGGTVGAVHAETVTDETVGLSEGVPGQRFMLQHRPVVAGDEPVVLEVAAADGWREWQAVPNFAGSSPADEHFVLDGSAGELHLGPAVREADGSIRFYGAVPPKGAPLRLRSYRHGGGRQGNVARGAITVLKSTLANVGTVENRRPAAGGVDGETLEEARDRAPVVLRTRDRAVTVEDYEALAREAAPEVARVRAVAAGGDNGADAGVVRVLVVPAVADDDADRASIRFEQLAPEESTLQRIAEYLDERRAVGARVVVEPPVYQGITVVARLRARPRSNPDRLRRDALRALYQHFHPLRGGPDGEGWPFGRPVHVGEVYGVLQRVRGVEFVEDARLFAADPITGDRGDQVQRLDVSRHSLVFSFDHQLLVER